MPNETSAQRLEDLEREVRKLRRNGRWQTVGLVGLLVGCAALGASQPQEITLRKLTIVDAEGTERIAAGTKPNGTANLVLLDREGKTRIVAATDPDGSAHLGLGERGCVNQRRGARADDGDSEAEEIASHRARSFIPGRAGGQADPTGRAILPIAGHQPP